MQQVGHSALGSPHFAHRQLEFSESPSALSEATVSVPLTTSYEWEVSNHDR